MQKVIVLKYALLELCIGVYINTNPISIIIPIRVIIITDSP